MIFSPLLKLYLLYGPPGSGKSTLARRLESEQQVQYISVGQITRHEIERKSVVGQQLKYYLDRVVEYPPDLISEIITNRQSALPRDCKRALLDGFPKYPAEAPVFLQLLRSSNIMLAAVIVLEGPSLENLLHRVHSRLFCGDCGCQTFVDSYPTECPQCGKSLKFREDDEPAILQRRYNDHISSIENTLSALNLSSGQIIHIGATESPDVIYTAACRELSFHLPE